MRSLFLLSLVSMTLVPFEAHAAGNPDKGEKVFARCQVCHSVDPAKKSSVGPNLAGVVGRKAASTVFNYSPAMKAAGFAWTAEKLDAFLARPSALVKGNRMAFGGMPNAQDRADLIAYLSTKK
jgi:cytochrome c